MNYMVKNILFGIIILLIAFYLHIAMEIPFSTVLLFSSLCGIFGAYSGIFNLLPPKEE